ncbi:hypothetical protein TFLX_05206 [Thermoflexales bacterium]|nr:hypothetical protein TFLX_05206 [Thermoflexales bacterium]
MTARNFRLILAGLFIFGFGFGSNYLTRIGAEKWSTLASIAAVLATLYMAIDIVAATETSLLYRINSWWIGPKDYRVGAMLLAVGCLGLIVFLIGKLVEP